MSGRTRRLTLYEKAEHEKMKKLKQQQLTQQQYRLQGRDEQQHIGQQHGQQLQQKPVARAEKKVFLYEKAELWYKNKTSQQKLQQQDGQHYLQKQQQQKVQQQLHQQRQHQQKQEQKPFQDTDLESKDVTVQGPPSAKNILLGNTCEQGLSRHSTQMSHTPAHSADHVQQNQQQEPNVDKSQEPIHSLVSDVMSMPPPALDPQGNERDASGRIGYVDGRHPGRCFSHESKEKVEPDLTLQTKKDRLISYLSNPRSGQIIEVTAVEMEKYCCWDKEIGRGSFGIVYEANIGGINTRKCVIKRIEIKEDEQYLKSYDREVYHGRILHPYIISIIARAEKVDDISRRPSAVYLMYPNMINRNVYTNIEKEEHGEESGKLLCDKYQSNYRIWLRCIYQVAHALDYLHNPGKNSSRRPVYHRDLTSKNILFDEDFNVKVCDFGLAVEGKYTSTDASVTTKHISSTYHPNTMDPERYSAFDDVYSFSVVILEILTGKVVKGHDHFNSYTIQDGDTCLLRDLNERAKRVKVARWAKETTRDHLAKTAHDVLLEGKKMASKWKKMNAIDFVKEADVRIESYIRYQKPHVSGRCVSCNVNPTANLALKGKNCDTSCKPFCVYCLTDQYNQLVCPRHGSTRPPFGDHVHGVFVAGNHVKELHGNILFNGNDPKTYADIAGIFAKDAEKLVNVLTSKFPLILGAREEHLHIVTPKEPGRECLLMEDIEKAFNESEKSIREALLNNPDHGDGKRIKNSLFVFYFTGHGDKENGLYLGGKGETINASTEWLKKMLHEKLLVDQILVILDCCHAAEQNFAEVKGESGFRILQLSSCDKDQKSICNQGNWTGSYFTHFLCQALRGDNFVSVGDGQCLKQCQDCEDKKKEHVKSPCEEFSLSRTDPQSVTLDSVKDYIRRHYEQLDLPMNLTVHGINVDEIHIGYYKPEEASLSIFLKGSNNGSKKYTIRSSPRSMSDLKQDIVRYIEKDPIQCEILDIYEFHKKLAKDEKTENLIKKMSSLVAIYPRVGKEKQEQTDLKDLWKIRPCGRALEARIRESVKGLKNGPVKIIGLNSGMTGRLRETDVDENLTIKKDYIHIQMKESILRDIFNLMNSSRPFSKEFKELLNELHKILQECSYSQNSDGIRVKEMKFKLYEEFAILEGE
ncbi:hypothetical protein ACJMK2_039253 [Sinanodonta woodiana]|uniref:Protein kinase domain-containing protein n=1 Tax=Sinanodonta woodiana TaxID=1069815 RepID=A0ABD3WCB2_SINWO